MDANGYCYPGIHGQIFRVGYGYTRFIPYLWPSLVSVVTPHSQNPLSLGVLCSLLSFESLVKTYNNFDFQQINPNPPLHLLEVKNGALEYRLIISPKHMGLLEV